MLLLLLLLPLLVCLSPSALGELGELKDEVGDEVEPDLSDFDLDIVSCSWSGWFLRTPVFGAPLLMSVLFVRRRLAGSRGR